MIEIDKCHRDFIYGIVRALKPKHILELGFGTGLTNAAITKAAKENTLGSTTVVDNFLDWNGERPPHITENEYTLIVDSEDHFIRNATQKYDLIVADADHNGTHKITKEIVGLLNPHGVAIFHDVTCDLFPNLRKIIADLPSAILFDKSSVDEEECHRGLLVYFSP